MKITAQDLLKFGIIDAIITAPAGGAHRDPKAAIAAVADAIASALAELDGTGPSDIRASRTAKFLTMGRKI